MCVLSSFLLCLQDNVQLIQEINDLRSDLKSTRTRVHDLEIAAKSQRLHMQQRVTGSSTSVGGSLTALTASPVAGYGTAVSLPVSTAPEESAAMAADTDKLRDALDVQTEELLALRTQYRRSIAGQSATLTFPPIRSASVTGQ